MTICPCCRTMKSRESFACAVATGELSPLAINRSETFCARAALEQRRFAASSLMTRVLQSPFTYRAYWRAASDDVTHVPLYLHAAARSSNSLRSRELRVRAAA